MAVNYYPSPVCFTSGLTNMSVITIYQERGLLPVKISALFSFLFTLCGILCNVFVGFYIGEKLKENSGVRVLLCNQILANIMTLLSYAIVPSYMLNDGSWNMERLCKIIPTVGFCCATVSIINVTALLVPSYRWNENGRGTNSCSTRTACIIVAGTWISAAAMSSPVMLAGRRFELNRDNTSVVICAWVWSNNMPHQFYINFVFILKYATPVLLFINVTIKCEVQRMEKLTPTTREVLIAAANVLTAFIILLLIYFFPLASLGNGKFLSPNAASLSIGNYVYLCEIAAVGNCAILPIVLIAFIEDYRRDGTQSSGFKKTPADEDILHLLPGNNTFITHDVLTADMPEKWRPNPSRVLIV